MSDSAESEYGTPHVRRGEGTDIFVSQEDNVILMNDYQARSLAEDLFGMLPKGSEIYRVGVHGARPILFWDLKIAQMYAARELDYENVEWRFSGDDMDLMHGFVDDDDGDEFPAVEIKREFAFHDSETATKWRKKRDRKEQRRAANE